MVHFIFRQMENELENVHLHQQRVSILAAKAAHIFDVTAEQKLKLVEAALYHDVGLVAIDMTIPNKKGLLDENEVVEVQRHSECGYRILSAITEYAEIADLILEHHEWYDGSGYPKNLRGNEIHKLSRILSVLDAYDAMTHERVYKDTYDEAEAIDELRRCSGSQFDPELVELFVKWLEQQP
jgi:HD-GYP domain-containing protein (c-di-GMP phosphodiesterase class II)